MFKGWCISAGIILSMMLGACWARAVPQNSDPSTKIGNPTAATKPTTSPTSATRSVRVVAKRAELQIFPGVCHAKGCRIEGRVVRPSRYLVVKDKISKRHNFMQAFRRFTRKGLKRARVEVQWRGYVQQAQTDRDGFFRVEFSLPSVSSGISTGTQHRHPVPILHKKRRIATDWPPWKNVLTTGDTGIWPTRLVLRQANGRSPLRRLYTASPIEGFAVAPVSTEGISVISDVDDTLIATHVTSKRKLLNTFLFKRFDQIQVFPGALDFLKQVLASPHGRGGGTLHYVTGSPALIYDRLLLLFRLRQFPLGSLFMKRLRGQDAAGLSDHKNYKTQLILQLLRTYPKQKFLLLGDSGEKDPEIYEGIRKAHPERIVGIFIHHVRKTPTTLPRFHNMVVFHRYEEAIAQARKLGLIR